MKLFAQHIIRYCAGLENSSGEEETGSFLQGNALLPRGGSIFTRPGRRWQELVRWSRGAAARPGQRNPGRPRREAHLGPRTPDPTWLTAASSPAPHLGRRHLAPKPLASPHPPAPDLSSPAASLGRVARARFRFTCARGGSGGGGPGARWPGVARARELRRRAPARPRGARARGPGRGRPPPARGPAARLGLVELLALGLQAVARPAAQHPSRHALDAVHPAAAAAAAAARAPRPAPRD